VKISILMRNEQLNMTEMRDVTTFITKFRQLLVVIISFHKVRFTMTFVQHYIYNC
jgi:hypothetical protein